MTTASAPDAYINSTPVQITGPTESGGAQVVGSVLATGKVITLVGGTIESVLDTNIWSSSATGSAAAIPVSNVLQLTTGVTANSSASFASIRRARYIVDHLNGYKSSVRLGDTGAANNIRRWGVYDSNNGYYFQLSGTTFGIGSRSGGSDTVVTSLNGQFSPVVDTNYHRYEIQYNQHSAIFMQDGLIIHTIAAAASQPIQSAHLVIGSENTNSGGGTANVSLFIAGAVICRYGNAEQRPRFFHSNFFGRVQSTSNMLSAAANTISTTLTAASTAGNLLVATVAVQANAIASITDNRGQTWTQATNISDGSGGFLYVYYVPNCVSGVTTITVTLGALVTDIVGIIAAEYKGVATTSPLDKTSTSNNGAVNVTAWTSGLTATTTRPVELLFGAAYDKTSATDTQTPATGWTTVASASGNGHSIYAEDTIVTTTGTYAATGTSSGSHLIYAAIATFAVVPTQASLITGSPTILKYGPGSLRGVAINTAGSGSPLLNIYDGLSTSGTPIATVSLSNTGNIGGSTVFDIDFEQGLTIVCNSTSADFTVIYD